MPFPDSKSTAWEFFTDDKILTLPLRIFTLLVWTSLIFGPAYIYRMSIKSTAWVHWPLAYAVRPIKYATNLEEIRARLWFDPREWLRRGLMTATFLGTLVVSLPSLSHLKQAFPEGVISFAQYALLLDAGILTQPWRMVALGSALITLALTWFGLEFSILVKPQVLKSDRGRRAETLARGIEYGMRVRELFGWAFWILIVLHAYLWLTPSTEWLPNYVKELIQAVYGDFLPAHLRSN